MLDLATDLGRHARRGGGFTLIELLIVIAIIAILALIAVPNFLEAQVRAKVSAAKSDMRTLATAIEAYQVDTNHIVPDIDSGIYGIVIGDESLTYAMLTTPIAYITSAPFDPFRPDSQNPAKKLYYEYWGGDVVVEKASRPLGANGTAWEQSGTRYVLSSVGPDRFNNALGGNMNAPANFCYDPTNGTVSRGDVGRSNARTTLP